MDIPKRDHAVAGVIIDISHEKLDRIFEYRIPEALQPVLEAGMEVNVPFGQGNRLRRGYVVSLSGSSEYPEEKLKEIDSICEKSVSMESKVLALACWMKERYGSTMINCLKTVLPVKKKMKESAYKTVECLASVEEIERELSKCNPRTHAARIRLLEEMRHLESLPLDMVTGKLAVSESVVKTLEKHGLVRLVSERRYRSPKIQKRESAVRHVLSREQQQAVDGIGRYLQQGISRVSLLHGITGSGKTEVYMELIGQAVARGQQAIVLIPEISLTFQTLVRFYGRFGDRVSVMHSRLSDGEKYDQYERARRGELDIIIGPRSALFVPFPNLGIIVIDEEHENSYKSEKMPKYHAREVAEYLAARENAQLVLGSATPSLESYFKARNGEYDLYCLKQRNGGAKLPEVETVDLRKEMKSGNRSFFSRELKERMTEAFVHGEQVMLFLNRRGYAGFVSCRSCGYVVKCPHCDVSLSQHGRGQDGKAGSYAKLVCHYCGYETGPVHICPECGSKYIAGFKAGTERIEAELKKEYPSVKVLRMDADTTKKKDDHEKILSAFANKEADVLVGTQMIVKGHDFSNVTLVGILAADLSLFHADYRAGERTFDLLVQACGRAGRGNKKGHVVIQTYQPDHYSIAHAGRQDYEGFYEAEMLYRRLLGYPPVCHLLAVQLFSRTREDGKAAITALAEDVKAAFADLEGGIIGPADAVFSRIRDIFRMVFYVKAGQYETLIRVKDFLEQRAPARLDVNQVLQFDFDPSGMF